MPTINNGLDTRVLIEADVFQRASHASSRRSCQTLERMVSSQPALVAPQRWKLHLAFVGVLAAGALMWFDRWFATVLHVERFVPTLVGTALGLVVLVATCLAVRCPACHSSLVWYGISKKRSGAWLDWLLTETTCPKCGHSSAHMPLDRGPGR